MYTAKLHSFVFSFNSKIYTTPKKILRIFFFFPQKIRSKKRHENIRSLLSKGNAFYMMKWNRNQIKKGTFYGCWRTCRKPWSVTKFTQLTNQVCHSCFPKEPTCLFYRKLIAITSRFVQFFEIFTFFLRFISLCQRHWTRWSDAFFVVSWSSGFHGNGTLFRYWKLLLLADQEMLSS